MLLIISPFKKLTVFQIEALRLELQQRPKTQLNNHVDNAADTDLLNIKRELEKAVETYKAKLTVEERDKIKLLGQISVLESQVNRYRAQAKSAVSIINSE